MFVIFVWKYDFRDVIKFTIMSDLTCFRRTIDLNLVRISLFFYYLLYSTSRYLSVDLTVCKTNKPTKHIMLTIYELYTETKSNLLLLYEMLAYSSHWARDSLHFTGTESTLIATGHVIVHVVQYRAHIDSHWACDSLRRTVPSPHW